MYSRLLIFFLLLTTSVTIYGAKALEKNTVKISVKGVVCSFCTQGIRKKLAEYDFINRDRFNKGLKMDIENQECYFAIKSGVKPDIAIIHKAIIDSGYEHGTTIISDQDGKPSTYKK